MTNTAQLVLAPTEHHPLGPSNFPVWAECSCYDGEKDLDDADLESLNESYAGRGTAQHLALALAMKGQANAFAGLTEQEEANVRWTAETIVQLAADAGYRPDEIQSEHRVTLLGSDFKVMYFGTVDAEFGPFLLDAKMGDEKNYFPQLAGYALAKMERDETTRVYGKIIYGRLRRVRHYMIDRRTAETVVYGILARRNSDYRRPRINEYCGWCRHKATCSALAAPVATIVDKREDWPIKLPTAHISRAAGDPVIAGALRYLWKAYIEPWGAGVEYLTRGMAANGITPLGFKLQSQKGSLEMTSPVDVVAALVGGGLEAKRIMAVASFSMEALVGAWRAQFGGTKDNAQEKIEEILTKAGAAKRGDGTKKLVRQKDGAELIASALARPIER